MKVRITKCVICDNLTLCVETERLDMRCKSCLEGLKADINGALERLEQEIDLLLSIEDDD